MTRMLLSPSDREMVAFRSGFVFVHEGADFRSTEQTECVSYEDALCMFSSVVTWPVCTEVDKRIGYSDIVSNQPMSVAKHAEHAECHYILIHPRKSNFTRACVLVTAMQMTHFEQQRENKTGSAIFVCFQKDISGTKLSEAKLIRVLR